MTVEYNPVSSKDLNNNLYYENRRCASEELNSDLQQLQGQEAINIKLKDVQFVRNETISDLLAVVGQYSNIKV